MATASASSPCSRLTCARRCACARRYSTAEVVCLDAGGRPDFNALLFRRGTPVFVAFDVLALDARDVRSLPLIHRKALLRRALPVRARCVLYADHVSGA